MKKIPKGIYQHYKGNKYQVLSFVRHSETLEELVLYRALYEKKELWVRPMKMFFQKVAVKGKKVPRFAFLKKENKK